jgi:hypothetical protein
MAVRPAVRVGTHDRRPFRPGRPRIGGLGRYVIRGGQEGYERLLLLSRDRWPDTAALFERAGLSPGMRCADLGGGGAAALAALRQFTADPRTLICGSRVFQLWSRR